MKTSKNPRKIRIAVVGLGWVGLNRHIRTIRRQPAFELVGVIDRRPGRAQSIALKLGLQNHAQAQSLHDVPWISGVDAVSVAVPPQSHFGLVQEALALGKHVLTEKPFVMSVADGEQLVNLAREGDSILAITHNFQFARSFLALQGDMESGRIGGVRSISAVQFSNPDRRLPEWYEELPMGLFYDESPHLLYLLRRLAGDQIRVGFVTAYRNGSARTPGLITAQFVGSATPVTLSANFNAAISEWYVMVHGEKAVGIVDLFRDIYLRLPNDQRHTTATVLRTSLSASCQHWAQHLSSGWGHLRGTLMYGTETVYARFAEAIRSGDRARDIGPEDALAIVKLQHAMINSAVILDSR